MRINRELINFKMTKGNLQFLGAEYSRKERCENNFISHNKMSCLSIFCDRKEKSDFWAHGTILYYWKRSRIQFQF